MTIIRHLDKKIGTIQFGRLVVLVVAGLIQIIGYQLTSQWSQQRVQALNINPLNLSTHVDSFIPLIPELSLIHI